jgi:hypothetical protein
VRCVAQLINERLLGWNRYMCIGAMAVTVSSYKLLELGVGPQYGRLCQGLIFAICIPVYLGAFNRTASKRVKKVGLAGFSKFAQSLAVSIETDSRVVLSWVWDAAGKLDEFELTQRCRLNDLGNFAAKGDVDVVAVVESSVLASHGPALIASADLVLCDATPLTDQQLRQDLLASAARAGRQVHVAWAAGSQDQQLVSASAALFRTHSKRGDSPVAREPHAAGWAVQLQQLARIGGINSVKLTFTQPISEVETATPTGPAFAAIRDKLKRRQRGSGATMVLHDGGCGAALSSPWAPALDKRLTHAIGCAMLALHRPGKDSDPSEAVELDCEPTFRWQVATIAAPVAGSSRPKKSSKGNGRDKDKDKAHGQTSVDIQDAQLEVAVVATSGASHTHSYTIPNSAEADRKCMSTSGVGAILNPLLLTEHKTLTMDVCVGDEFMFRAQGIPPGSCWAKTSAATSDERVEHRCSSRRSDR